MSTKETAPIFSPVMTTWVISLAVGVLIPLFTQDLVISSLTNLSGMVQDVETAATADPAAQLTSALFLLGLFITGVTAVAFQILIIAKTLKVATVFALVVTIVAPVIVWIALPYILIAFN